MKNNNYISDFQLIGTRINNLKISNNFISYEETDSTKKILDVTYELGSISIDENEYISSVFLFVNITVEDTHSDQSISIQLEIEGGFSMNSQTKQSTFIEMLELNGCSSLYSIARSIIINTTAMTFEEGKITLPMINVFKLREEKNKHR